MNAVLDLIARRGRAVFGMAAFLGVLSLSLLLPAGLYAAAAPTIASITPSSGVTTGGSSVTISGTNFDATATVTIGGTAVTSTSWIDASTLTVVTPAGSVGPRDVVVTNNDGQKAILLGGYRYAQPAPTLSSLSATSGPVKGGQVISLTGSGFTVDPREVTQLSTGGSHSCGVYHDKAYCWGYNTYGQLGRSDTTNSVVPIAVDTSGVLAGKTIKMIATGNSHTCAIASDNQAYCWGYNNFGQLGNNTTNQSLVPVAVDTSGVLAGKTLVSITAGSYHNCVVASDNQAYCWGSGSNGQLGNNSTTMAKVPVAVSTSGVLAGKTIKTIADGDSHTCAIASDNLAYCWGANTYGQLGNNSTTQSLVPVAVSTTGVLAGKTIRSLGAGLFHNCVVASDNLAYCWGYNNNGQLGNNSATQSLVPVAVTTSGVLAGKTIRAVSAAQSHTCAIASDNQPYCWGFNNNGQLGNNSATQSLVPVATSVSGVLAGKNLATITTGGNVSCATTSEDKAVCWGYNNYGQLGNNSTTQSLIPVTVTTVQDSAPSIDFGGVLSDSTQLVSSSSMAAVNPTHSTGAVSVTMTRSDGQSAVLTNGYTYNQNPSVSGISPASAIKSGGDTITISGASFSSNATVAIGGTPALSTTWVNATTLTVTVPAGSVGRSDVSITNADGQTATLSGGLSYTEPAPTITSISPPAGPAGGSQQVTVAGSGFTVGLKNITQLSAGNEYNCGVYNSQVYCWGYNDTGRAGKSTSTTYIYVPTVITDTNNLLTGKAVRSISAGAGKHTCAITSDNQAYCWGANNYGQLGDGTTTDSYAPVAVKMTGALSGKKIVSIVVGAGHTCVLTTDGGVYCWGDSTYGQLGNNSLSASTAPVAIDMTGVLAGKAVKSITAGGQHTCALATDGTVSCWGYDIYGQLGNNTTTNSRIPVAVTTSGVLSGKTVTSLAAGTNHTCAIASDNQAYCWGSNSSGQLGNNSGTNASTPVAVTTSGALAGKTITAISGGLAHTCAIASGSQAYCWGGDNAIGVSGSSLVPVAVTTSGVLAGKTMSSIAAGTGISGAHTCVIASDSQTYCWGYSRGTGVLGDNPATSNSSNTPLTTVPVKGANPVVKFDTTGASGVQLVSDTQLSMTTPAHVAATVNVSATNYDTQAVTASGAYAYVAAPQATSVSPSSGLIDGGSTATITGANFYTGMKVKVGSVYSSSVTVVNGTTLTFTVPAAADPGNVTLAVEDPYGASATVSGGYTYKLSDPTISSVTPTAASQGTTVTITGTNFAPKSSGGTWYTVMFGTTTASLVTYVNSTTLQVVTPPHVLGTVDVTVQSSYSGSAKLTAGFTYIASSYAFTNSALSVTANEPGKLTIQAKDSGGSPITSSVATVITLASSSSSGAFARDLTEDNSTRWSYHSVILPAGASSVSVWYKDSQPGTPTITGTVQGATAFTQAATINSPYKLKVTGISSPIQVGQPSSVTVSVVDYAGVPLSGYTGTLTFSSTDTAASLPAQYTMTSSDHGFKTFVNGVAMGTQGSNFCVTVTDSTQSPITGQQCGISATAPSSGTITKLAIISPTQNFPLSGSSSAITVQTQGSDGSAVPVASATTVYMFASSSTGQFSTDQTTWSSTSPFPVTIHAGQTAANVYYRDSTARSTTVSARDLSTDTADGSTGDYGWTNATQTIVSGVGQATKLVISGPSTLLTNAHGHYTIEAQDAGGNAVTAPSDILVHLGSTMSSTSYYLPSAPSTALTGTIDITIPGGSMRTTYDMSDSAASIGTAFNAMTVVDGRDSTTTARLSDGTMAAQIVNAYPTTVKTTTGAASVEAGQPVGVTVQLTDANGTLTPATADTTINLSSSAINGQFSVLSSPFTPTSNLQIPKGSSSATLYFKDPIVGTVQLTAGANGLTASGTSIDVTSSATARFSVTGGASAPLGTASGAYTITGYDIYGNVAVQTSNLSAYLYSDQVSTQFASSTSGPWTATSVTIPTGQSSAQFYLKDSSFHGGPLQITIGDQPTLDQPDTGIINATTSVAITSQPVAQIVMTSSQQSLTAGQASGVISVELHQADGSLALQDGTTTLALGAPDGHFMATQDPAASAITASTVARGTASTSFYYTGTKAGGTTLIFSLGAKQTTQSITVTPAAAASLLYSSTPQSINNGAVSNQLHLIFKDTYGNPVASGTSRTINLSSSCSTGQFSEDGANWLATSTIAVASSSTDVSFYYKDLAAGNCTLTAATNGLSSAAQSIAIAATAPTQLSLAGSLQSMIKGQPRSLTINLLDASGNNVPAEAATTVYLTSSSASGSFNRSTVTFNIGDASQTVTYTDTAAGQPVISVRDQVGSVDTTGSLVDTSRTVTYTDGSPQRIVFATPSTTMTAGGSATLSISLLNEYNQPLVPTSPVTVSLSSSVSGGNFFDQPNSQTTPITSTTIAAGQATATIYYRQSATTTAQLLATSPSLQSGSESVTVLPQTVYEARFTNTAYQGASALEISQPGQFTVSLYDVYGNVATAGADTTLYAHTNNSSGTFSAGGQFVIPAGGSSASLQYTQETTGSYSVSVDDTMAPPYGQGLQSGTQTGEVVSGAPGSFTYDRSSVTLERGGVTDGIRLTLMNSYGRVVAAPSGGQTVSLSMMSGTGTFSDAPNGSFSPTLSLNVPAGATTASFYYRNDNGLIEDRSCSAVVNGSRTCSTTHTYSHQILGTLSASGTSYSKALNVQMSYGAPVRYAITTPARQQEAGRPSSVITIERQNQYGQPVPLYSNVPIYLKSSASSGQFGSTKTNWGVSTVAMLDSASSVDVYYKDSTVGAPTLTAADNLPLVPDINLVNATQTVTIVPVSSSPAPVASFYVANITDPEAQGTHSSVVVMPLDANGYIVDSYSGTISFTSSDPTALLPDNYTFDPTVDKGSKTFTNQVAFTTTGQKTVTVTDGAGKTGSQTGITVSAGNTSAVASVTITQPTSPTTFIKNVASHNITVELLDSAGQPTSAPVGGLPVHLTSSTSSGQFALKATGPWTHSLDVTVPAGLSFANVYYLDSQLGNVTITAADWKNATDNPAIANGQLDGVVQSIGIDGGNTVMSRNVFGVLEPSKYLFAHDSSGTIQGNINQVFNSLSLQTSTSLSASWRTQLRQGVNLLLNNESASTNSTAIQKNDTVTRAGQPDFYAVAQATDTTFDNPAEVVSRQYTIPTSPWKASVDVSPYVVAGSNLAATVQVYQHDSPTSPDSMTIAVLPADATDASHPVQTWGAITPGSTVQYTFPTQTASPATASGVRALDAGLPLGSSYRLFITTYDTDGNTTSQVLSNAFTIVAEVPVTNPQPPTVPSPQAPDTPAAPAPVTAPSSSPAPSASSDTTPSPAPHSSRSSAATPQASNQPTIHHQSNPTQQPTSPALTPQRSLASIINRNVTWPVTAVLLTGTVLLVVLLRVSYLEVRRVRSVRGALQRTNTQLTTSFAALQRARRVLTTISAQTPAVASSVTAVSTLLHQTATIYKQQQSVIRHDREVARATRPVFDSMFFWLPIILSAALSYGIIILLRSGNAGIVSHTVVIYSSLIVSIVALCSLAIGQKRYANRLTHKAQLALEQCIAASEEAQRTLREASQRLLAKMEASLRQLRHVVPPADQSKAEAGLQHLEDLKRLFEH